MARDGPDPLATQAVSYHHRDGPHAADTVDLVKRDFTAQRPATKVVGDITYIRTWQGWLYLAVAD